MPSGSRDSAGCRKTESSARYPFAPPYRRAALNAERNEPRKVNLDTGRTPPYSHSGRVSALAGWCQNSPQKQSCLTHRFCENIIGSSTALGGVLDQIRTVAPTDST